VSGAAVADSSGRVFFLLLRLLDRSVPGRRSFFLFSRSFLFPLFPLLSMDFAGKPLMRCAGLSLFLVPFRPFP